MSSAPPPPPPQGGQFNAPLPPGMMAGMPAPSLTGAELEQSNMPPPVEEVAAPAAGPVAHDPGSYDNLFNEVRALQCNSPGLFFDGLKFTMSKTLSPNFQVSHSLNLGSQKEDDSYHFSPTYMGGSQATGGLPLVMADVDSSGNIVSQLVHQLTSSLRLKLQAQSHQKEWAVCQMEADYEGSDYCAGIKLVNVNPIEDSGIFVANYLQKIRGGLALGAEMAYHKQGSQEGANMTFGGRYRSEHWSSAFSCSPAGILQLGYFHSLNEQTHMSAEFELDARTMGAKSTAAYMYSFRSGSTIRCQLNSKGVVSSVWDQQIAPGFTFSLSAYLDHVKKGSLFGIGLSLQQ